MQSKVNLERFNKSSKGPIQPERPNDNKFDNNNPINKLNNSNNNNNNELVVSSRIKVTLV